MVSSVSAHLHPASEQVRRVTHAVERAALAQLIAPARWGLGGALLLGVMASAAGMQRGIPLLWTLLVPLLGTLLSGVSLFLAARIVHRAVARSVLLNGLTPSLGHCARDFMAAVTLSGGTAVALGWSIEFFAQGSLDGPKVRFLVLLALVAAGFTCALLSRAATSSALTSHVASPSAPLAPHGGSLATLVGSSFHYPLSVLCVWSLLAMLSHLAFLPPHAGTVASAVADDRILYLPLLQLLGLFAVGFGACAVRVSEGEAPRWGWMRAGLVAWALLVIGCWSFSSQLPPALVRSTPACMSGFFVLLPVFVSTQPTIDGRAARALSNGVGFLVLLTVLVTGCARLSFLQLSPSEISGVLGAGAIAALPLGVVWLFANSVDVTRRGIASLAFVDLPTAGVEHRGGQLLGLVPGLGLLIAVATLQARFELPQGGSLLELGLSIACGAAGAALANYLLETNCAPFQKRLGALVTSPPHPTDAVLDLEAANKVCEAAISSRTWLWVLTVTAPAAFVLMSRLAFGQGSWVALGLALGACIFGAGHAWSTHHTPSDVLRMTGMTSLSSCLLQFLLIFLMMSSF